MSKELNEYTLALGFVMIEDFSIQLIIDEVCEGWDDWIVTSFGRHGFRNDIPVEDIYKAIDALDIKKKEEAIEWLIEYDYAKKVTPFTVKVNIDEDEDITHVDVFHAMSEKKTPIFSINPDGCVDFYQYDEGQLSKMPEKIQMLFRKYGKYYSIKRTSVRF